MIEVIHHFGGVFYRDNTARAIESIVSFNVKSGKGAKGSLMQKKNFQHAVDRNSRTYYLMKYECPQLVKAILHDLLTLDGFSETEIAFGADVPMELIRKIRFNKNTKIRQPEFLALLDFFSRLYYRPTR